MLYIFFSQTRSVNKLVNKLLAFAEESKKKSQQLASEERKAVSLLCQIMPKPVAKMLRRGVEVSPAHFQSVTICYIDIVGFMAIISRLKPVQVTSLFNQLYG